MSRIQETKKQIYVPEIPVYTTRDFQELNSELEKYKINKKFKINQKDREVRYVPVEGLKKWYFDKGATTKDFAVINIPLFRELQEKLSQLNMWEKKKEYAIKMQLKDYEKMEAPIIDNVQIQIEE